MEIFFRILGYLSIPMLLFSVFFMIKSIRRDRRLMPRSLIIPIITSLVFLVVYNALLGVSPPTVLSWLLMAVGAVIGAYWSRTTQLNLQNGAVFGQRSIWYLVIWGLTIGVTQLLALMASEETAAYGLSTIYFSSGLAIGTNVSLLFRRWRLVASGVTTAVRCPGCGNVEPGAVKFCTRCGHSLAPAEPVPDAPAPDTPATCVRCGYANSPQRKFCTKCGNPLN